MRRSWISKPNPFPIAALFFLGSGWVEAQSGAGSVPPAFDQSLYQALEYRSIGPSRGGRAPTVAGVPGQLFTFYMGTSGGGVWKTTDAGTTWDNISDGFFEAGSIGAIAVADSDPNILYAGTGESCLRGDVQTGVGVYKSRDAGKTWKHIGLESSGQIGRIRVHPKDPDLVYVAVLGHAFGPNEERGVFRSKDGGASWEKVLYVSDEAGAVDLSMDVNNPLVLYAAIYQVVRKPWMLVSGGEHSGLYKSTDGGDSWTELKNGLPTGIKGKIGVAVSPANSDRVYADIEADDGGGVYRSDDGGESFVRVSKDRKLVARPFYFNHVVADAVDENTVYVMNLDFFKSVDGGRTYEEITGTHGDFHDLWINPDNPEVMVSGNDGGGAVSLNGGKSWSTQMNQPTAEFYRVAVDNQFPYRVYGPQQDNSSISVPSRVARRNVVPDMYEVGGGEQGHIWVHPTNPNIVYAGEYEGQITRYDRETGDLRNIETYPQLPEGLPAEALKYRFQMNAPIRVSPHAPHAIYHASQYVHRSTDEGQSWEIISPDLTTNDKSKQGPSGGPITKDHTGPETYCTIFAFEESPHQAGLFWVGTDDGLVHVSRDGGATWTNITPEGMPEWGTVNMIELSPHDAGRAFIAVHRYRLDDFTPYIYRTDDYGKSWTRLADGANGIPANHFVRVVREDPFRKGLLYAGTEFGMYVSFNDGTSWQSLQLNLPIVQIADMVIKEQELVVATHGRSFWILDDITPLHQIDEAMSKTAYLFESKDAYRRTGFTAYYNLTDLPGDGIKLEFLESNGKVIQTFSSNDDAGPPAKKGMNRFDWNLRYPAADVVDDALWFGGRNAGPIAVPGAYEAKLTVGESTQTVSFEVKKDPRLETSRGDYQEQFDLAIEIRDEITRLTDAVRRIRNIRGQVDNLSSLLNDAGYEGAFAPAATSLTAKLTALEEKLMQTKNEAGPDTSNFPPRLDSQLIRVSSLVIGSEHRPTDGNHARFDDLKIELDAYIEELQGVLDDDLAAFNDLLANKNVTPVILPAR
ncbi:MAG: glycosyl hydrolase [Acidobacteria bacterium]|nr:MAG: glycosyl hydrolase [Acidobacteriota bacterium]